MWYVMSQIKYPSINLNTTYCIHILGNVFLKKLCYIFCQLGGLQNYSVTCRDIHIILNISI